MGKRKDITRAALLAVEQDDRVKREYQLLEAEFTGCPCWEAVLSPLAAQAAFLSVMIAELQCDVLAHGVDETYMNGQNQSGRKKRAAADLVVTYGKLHASVMAVLTKELEKGKVNEEKEDDELVKFLRGDRPAKRSWGAEPPDEFEQF